MRVRVAGVMASLLLVGVSLFASASPAGAVATPALDANGSLVTAAFYDFLGRYPTPSELTTWQDRLETGTSVATLVGASSGSQEWTARIVTRFYEDTLGRAPDIGGLTYWTSLLRSGRMTPAHVAASFYASDEYFAGKGGDTDASWVTDLYAKLLSRSPDQSGLSYWVGMIATHGRVGVASALYQSEESCRQRVTLLYHELLQRDPDSGGLNSWSGRIAQVGDIVVARYLASSAEYGARAVVRFGNGQRPPLPPTAVTITPEITQLIVSWNAPTNPGGSSISGYTATAQPGGETCTTWLATTCTIEGLQPGTAYTVTVVAQNGDGSGSPSIPSPSATTRTWQLIGGSTPTQTWRPRAMNDSGLIVGDTPDGKGFSCQNPCTSPSLLPGSDIYAGIRIVGVSSSGEIVGTGYRASIQQGLAWSSPTASPTELQAPAGATEVYTSGVTSSGVIIGWNLAASAHMQSVSWASASAAPSVLPNPPGYGEMWVQAVSPSGLIVGSNDDSQTHIAHALAFASMSAPPTMLPEPPDSGHAFAVAVSPNGIIAGMCDVAGVEHLCRWPSMSSAPSLLNTPSVEVCGESDYRGWVTSDGDIYCEGLVWTTASPDPTQLSAPAGYHDLKIAGVSPNGKLVGTVLDAGNATHGFVAD